MATVSKDMYEELHHTARHDEGRTVDVSKLAKPVNDFMNAPGRWNGPTAAKRTSKPWTPEQLAALRLQAPPKRPTFAEKMAARAAANNKD